MSNTFDLKIGFKCNNNCIHCVVAEKRKSGTLSVPTIFKLIEEVPEGDIIQITGGEPSIFPYLPDVLKKCKELGHETIVQTNATGFSDIELVKECASYIDHAHVAIHSCYTDIHDEIVGSAGMWDKTMIGFMNLLSNGVYCTTQTVVSKLNIETIYDTFSFIQKIQPGITMSLTYPHMMGNAFKNRESICFRYSDHKDIILKTLKEFKDNMFVEAIPPCYLHPYYNDVCTNEKVIIENLKSSSSRIGVDFSNGFNRKNYDYLDIENHRKGPLCKKCIYNKSCIGVWKEYIDLFKRNLDLFPIEESLDES